MLHICVSALCLNCLVHRLDTPTMGWNHILSSIVSFVHLHFLTDFFLNFCPSYRITFISLIDKGSRLLFFHIFPSLAQIPSSSLILLLIVHLLYPVLVYSLLHVYWFFNFYTPFLFIPSSLDNREMRVHAYTLRRQGNICFWCMRYIW